MSAEFKTAMVTLEMILTFLQTLQLFIFVAFLYRKFAKFLYIFTYRMIYN